MTEVKICGITSLEDAQAAAGCGANAIGFIFHPKSPRFITPEEAREISLKVAGRVCRVGVFVDGDAEEVRTVAEFCGLDLIQFHGNESPEYCRGFPPSMLIKAVCFRKKRELAAIQKYSVRAILVDAYDPALHGGTGKTCDWNLAREAGEKYPLILSGGLNAGNIASAIAGVRPLAVDVGSGVEERPGKKDPEKIVRFMAAVRGVTTGRGFPSQRSVFQPFSLLAPLP